MRLLTTTFLARLGGFFALVMLNCTPCSHASIRDCALVLTGATDIAGMDHVISEVEAAGGHATHVFPFGAFIAELPVGRTVRVSPPARIARGIISASSADRSAAMAISAWNGALRAEADVHQRPRGAPLVNDALLPVSDRVADPSSPQSSAPDYWATSYFMIGKVAVGVVLPESEDGDENWTLDRQNQVLTQVVLAMDWWCQKGGPAAKLTFCYDVNFSVPCGYEPITISSGAHYLWLKNVLQEMGYDCVYAIDGVREYVNNIRASFGADWGFAIFVADSLEDDDGRFPDDVFAFAYTGGPYMVMTYDNNDWGIEQMHYVASHEAGHIFYAADEYCNPSFFCCDFGNYGYLNTCNCNCEHENPSSVPCIMRHNDDAACQYTCWHVGWRDSDGDGILDPVDTTPEISSASYETDGQGNITYTGCARDVPYPATNAVTINDISAVEYRVNGDEWRQASAVDGSFNSDVEDFIFTVSPPPASPTLEIRATNTVGNYSPYVLLGPGDTTPPTTPRVSVAPFVASLTQIEAWWSAEDPESGISAYQYCVGTVPKGTDTLNWASAGTSTHALITGLNLTRGVKYYVSVKAKNANGLWSDAGTSNGVMVVDTLGAAGARSSPDGMLVGLESVVVSAGTNQFGNLFYVQSADRTAGIEVVPAPGVQVMYGSIINLSGYTGTVSFERRIAQPITLSVISTGGEARPLLMTNQAIGGGDFNIYTNGVDGGGGLNNIGLLVCTTGKVTYVDTGQRYFYVNDGSGVQDPFPQPGVRVSYAGITGQFSPPSVGAYVRVTGINTIAILTSKRIRTIRVRDSTDVLPLQGP